MLASLAEFESLDSLANPGTASGRSLVGVIGGQLANLFGFLNPDVDMSNPILLFSFQVRAMFEGQAIYTPGQPHPEGALSYYPDATMGPSINSNMPGTTLTLIGAKTRIIPAPASLALLGLGAMAARRRR
ncbi:MAG: PEP-CTERM sorting domain-containing protein [Phycisphaeraceae bacterium]|nr:PEP-CTERM sorting domain-containing protein [Phycisphaeraceae bacterium]MCW5762443.1 PEP-CTERM sorting domain-containing protein [Phycisphaeraceae bacterium]